MVMINFDEGVIYLLSFQIKRGSITSGQGCHRSVSMSETMPRILAKYLNFANIVVVPVIIGIGIYDNIHIYQRYQKETKGSK